MAWGGCKRPKMDFTTTVGRTLLLLILVLIMDLSCGAELTYSVEEEKGSEYIGNVGEDYDLRSTMTQEEYSNLVYRILSSGNSFAHFFRIEYTTGKLFTKEPIDRDNLTHCSRTLNCVISLDIAVQATIGAFFRKINVDINVIDLNDNSPVFPKGRDSATFLENSVEGTSASIDGAQDSDSGNNTVVRYYVDTPDVPFDVMLEKMPDGSSTVKIVVNGKLDREEKDFYQIRLVAEDGGDPKRTGAIVVDINIEDMNDNSPQFDRPFYNVTLNEDMAINTVFETISATDDDAGQNGQVEYRISANQNDAITKTYAIDPTSGELSVISQLVYIPNVLTQIFVDASDKGAQPRTTQIPVYVNIIDSSNNPPEINVNILQGNINARISEYANVGAPVAHIAVIDGDTGRNGKVECIGISDNFGLERYETNEYKAVVTKPLNRELVQTHEVTIVCRDSGSPPLNSTTSFLVVVVDQNDNPPRFSQGTYFAKAEENNLVGDVVAAVSATDIDTGNNSKIEYKLLSTGGYSFWIDPDLGEIRANFRLDRENVTKIEIIVEAQDNGNPKMSATSTVVLSVTDQNDNYPIFSQPNYEFFVLEGVPHNTTVDQLTATDKDYRENGTVSFSFDTSPPASFPFSLYSDGTVKMIRTLDREKQGVYKFTVVASDQSDKPLSSSVTVTVIVLDVNDNAPVFVFPDVDNNTATIPLSSAPDSVTIVVVATDIDADSNGEVSYTILDNNMTSLFYIESVNGVGNLRLRRAPGASEPLQYTLRIKAMDNGKPSQSSIQLLTIVFAKDAEEPSNRQNFLIAISLGCVTVVLSIAIVLTIYLIRRHDRLRTKSSAHFNDRADMEIVPGDMKHREELGSTSSGSKESLKKVSFSTDHNSSLESDPNRDVSQSPLVNLDNMKNILVENGRVPSSASSPRSYSSSQQDPDMQRLDPSTVLQIHRSLLQSHDQLWTNHRDGHTII
ncbi:protocadherin-9-like isoform X2 [Mercenaria mercenaria]|uniref:protocadherin-9-like isoform X2 n=1 Tax=Mercenaria mercenaria TaxID=6596 RepID=UPI00234F472B|nr:protocadherin-9-like isoform X2 [Mercenaria mercenaria]